MVLILLLCPCMMLMIQVMPSQYSKHIVRLSVCMYDRFGVVKVLHLFVCNRTSELYILMLHLREKNCVTLDLKRLIQFIPSSRRSAAFQANISWIFSTYRTFNKSSKNGIAWCGWYWEGCWSNSCLRYSRKCKCNSTSTTFSKQNK